MVINPWLLLVDENLIETIRQIATPNSMKNVFERCKRHFPLLCKSESACKEVDWKLGNLVSTSVLDPPLALAFYMKRTTQSKPERMMGKWVKRYELHKNGRKKRLLPMHPGTYASFADVTAFSIKVDQNQKCINWM